MIVTLALGKQRQEDHKFEVNLSYMPISSLQNQKGWELLFSGMHKTQDSIPSSS